MDAPAPASSPHPDWLEYSEDLGNGRFATRVRVAGIHCAACAGTIEHLVQGAGAIEAQINSATGRARVVWQAGQTEPARWMQAVESGGYTMAPIAGVDWLEATRLARRRALWRWLVAAFCMMQIMMLMWPFYGFSGDWGGHDLDAQSATLLRWGMLMLSVPVLLFSSGDFFRAAWRDVKNRRISMDLPVALGIAITFGVSCMATAYPRTHWGALLYFDSLSMFVFILLSGRWLEAHLRVQTAGALDAITTQAPQRANRLQADGSVQNIPLAQLRVGDTVRVLAGELLPADGQVLQGESWVDESLLTGESKPVHKTTGSAVVAGSSNQSQTLLVRVEKVGQDTRYAQIVALMERAAEHKPRLVRLADRMAQPFLLLIVLLAAAAWGWWSWQGDANRGLISAINVLIVTCPCALALAAPAALLSATAHLARRGIVLRDIGALERLANSTWVLWDKTGTLSQDRLALAQIHSLNALDESQALALAQALAAHSLHPASRALALASTLAPSSSPAVAASTVHEEAGHGLEGQVPCSGLFPSPTLRTLRLGRASWCGVSAAQASAHAGMQVWLSDVTSGQVLAGFSLHERLRDDAQESLRALRAMGLGMSMATGDSTSAAERMAAALDLGNAWQAACSPEDKLAALAQLQGQGERVLMVGDGINDGPVLAGAHVSAAVAGAAPLAQVQADLVLLQPQLAHIPASLAMARRSMRVVRQNLLWALLYNGVAIPLALMGHITPWIAGLGMACSSLAVLLNAARLQRMR